MNTTDFNRLTLEDLNEILSAVGDNSALDHLSSRNASLIADIRADAGRLHAVASTLRVTLARVDSLRSEHAGDHRVDPANSDGVSLSRRQLEILSWVARGKSNSVIASILGISAHTVDTHLRRVFERLDTSDRTVAAIRAVQYGWIPEAA